jgi:hypothetical protein
MSKNPSWLPEHASNTYSQNGEDGVVAKILSMLPHRDKWCVEFGAWDGVHLSNVRKLILEQQYNAILIEGDAERCKLIAGNYAGNAGVFPVNTFVGFDVETGLDSILRSFQIPQHFDFLSVDIDGNDYHVWNAVNAYRPKVVCVEFNPTIPTEVDFVQPADPRVSQGASLLALDRLAREKGYQTVCVLPWNVFFVDEKYYPLFEINDNRPATMRQDSSFVTWIFSGYDGSIHLKGAKSLPWHGIPLHESSIKGLPGLLRVYPHNYSPLQRACFRLFKVYRRLTSVVKHRNS